MMDVNKLIKVNELAKDLLAKGMAKDSQEASMIAEQMLDQNKDKEEKPVSEIREKMQEIKSDVKKDNDDSELRKIVYQLSRHESMISEIQDKINEIIKEFNAMNDKIEKLDKFLHVETQSKLVINNDSSETKQESSKSENKINKEATDKNPRSGDYKPEDVSIDKMFYYGNK